MLVNIVKIIIKPEMRKEFLEATLYNHENSRREPGNIRFDVLQSANEPDTYILYEVFTDEKAVENHKMTGHYKRWADIVRNCMAAPRSGNSYTPVAFD